ncbi:MAG: Ig-like domain-containing protein, partial [Pirellulaceae bacterium]|nr:Ig-like domain-containing protein [Pirellulaceae bacterium]
FMPTFPDTEDWENELVLSDNYTDYDNNPGSRAESDNYMVDDRDPSTTHGSPTITLENRNSDDDTLLSWNQTAYLLVNFQEPVTANFESDNATDNASFTTSDINLDNATGTLAAMSYYLSDNKSAWRGIFAPTDDTEVDNNTITLAASWYDQVGNPGTSVTTSNFKVDTKRPAVSSFTFSVTDNTTFTNSDNIDFPGLKPGDNATLTLVFSEVVTNFSSADDITADNVTLATMISSNNIIWTGIFTPTDNISELNNTLTLADGYTDIAGNTGTGTSAKWSVDNATSIYVIDTGAAAVSSFSPANNVCIPITDNIIVTFDFPMFTTSITSDTSTGCGASIMVSSSDDSGVFFSTPNCVPFPGNPVASDNNTTFTLDPVENLSYDTTYKIKVTGGADADPEKAVKSALENILSTQYVSSFRTYTAPSSVSGLFMAVGSSGKILRSTDNGSSWDNATSCQFSTNLDDVTFGNNTFVAVGTSGNIVRSTDNGSSFDNVTSNTSNLLYGVTFGNDTFVGVGTS